MDFRNDNGDRRRGLITIWTFWLADQERGAGRADHGSALRFVAAGNGETPEIAWQQALSRDRADLGLPECVELPETLIAIRDDHQLRFRAGARRGRVLARASRAKAVDGRTP